MRSECGAAATLVVAPSPHLTSKIIGFDLGIWFILNRFLGKPNS
jgi:hypothetical protein